MPSARVNGGPHALPAARVFVVAVYPDGTKMMMEVLGAQLTLERQYEDVAWWHGLTVAPDRTTVRLDGVLGTQEVYTGDIPDQQRELGQPRPAIERGA